MALEGHDVCTLVWNRLTADAGAGGVNTLLGGRIYQDQIPQAATLPAATVGLVAAPDANTLGGVHVLSIVDVDVRVVASGTSYGPIVAIARRVNAVLDGFTGLAGESYACRLRRIDFRRLPEDDAGASFRHLIGTYRTEAHPGT
jgi:hypothetical protein